MHTVLVCPYPPSYQSSPLLCPPALHTHTHTPNNYPPIHPTPSSSTHLISTLLSTLNPTHPPSYLSHSQPLPSTSTSHPFPSILTPPPTPSYPLLPPTPTPSYPPSYLHLPLSFQAYGGVDTRVSMVKGSARVVTYAIARYCKLHMDIML